MDFDAEPTGIQALRLFPLGGVVLFPHAVLPLHIFEPRYRQMTEDALASDGLVTIIMVRPADEWKGSGPPKLEEYGCVGRIVKHQRLPDGRFNFLLVGLKRVRLIRELPTEKLYRIAEAEVVDDREASEDGRAALIAAFRRYCEPRGGIDPELQGEIDSDLPLGVLADIMAHVLTLPPAIKQQLLSESRPDVRARTIALLLGESTADVEATDAEAPDRSAHFPPPFSAN